MCTERNTQEPERNEVVPGPLELRNKLQSFEFKVKTTAALISMTTYLLEIRPPQSRQKQSSAVPDSRH